MLRACMMTMLVLANVAQAEPMPFQVKVTGKGQAMILIPGLASSGEVWNDTVKQFQGQHECHVLTLAGFAGVPAVEGPFVDTVRTGLVTYIRDHKLSKPVIVGHSLGGYLAYLLASTESDLLGPVIAVDGLPFFPGMIDESTTQEKTKAQAVELVKQIQNAPRETFLAQQKMTLTGWIDNPAQLERAIKWSEASDQSAVARAVGDLWGRDLRPDTAKIRVPVLLLAAPNAGFGMPREQLMKRYDSQVAKIPNKTVAFAPNAKHFIMFDEPAWMHERMTEFLNGK